MTETGSENAQNAFSADVSFCETCGTKFLRRRRWQRYCSDRCRKESFKKPSATGRFELRVNEVGEFGVFEISGPGAELIGEQSAELASALKTAAHQSSLTFALPILVVK